MLVTQLDAGSARKLTLIEAPAGYGKTTLLNQWRRAEESNRSFAWVSLDKQDNDPIRLWKHIVEALHQVVREKQFGADVLVGLGMVVTNFVETALPALINDLAELSHWLVLVCSMTPATDR
jgi:LuxR family transcriptional regulator, maltose regulon positive regulatory protein